MPSRTVCSPQTYWSVEMWSAIVGAAAALRGNRSAGVRANRERRSARRSDSGGNGPTSRWFLAFPLAALVGGAVTGLVVGAGQALVARRRPPWRRWVPATVVGMGLGLTLGSSTVGFGTTLPELALMGALTGLVLGPAQAFALSPGTSRRWAWAVSMPLLWALGWVVTTLAGVDVDSRYTVFGATGALTFSALSGGLLLWVLPRSVSVPSGRTPA